MSDFTSIPDSFFNPTVSAEDLPQMDAMLFRPLETAYKQFLYVRTLIFWALVFMGWIFFLLFTWNWSTLWLSVGGSGLWLSLAAFSLYAVHRGFERKGYALRERDISYRSGWLFKHWISIPYNRIQHCELRQGVIESSLDLMSLNIYTAGGSSSDLTIPGLKPDIASRIRDYIIKKSPLDEEE